MLFYTIYASFAPKKPLLIIIIEFLLIIANLGTLSPNYEQFLYFKAQSLHTISEAFTL